MNQNNKMLQIPIKPNLRLHSIKHLLLQQLHLRPQFRLKTHFSFLLRDRLFFFFVLFYSEKCNNSKHTNWFFFTVKGRGLGILFSHIYFWHMKGQSLLPPVATVMSGGGNFTEMPPLLPILFSFLFCLVHSARRDALIRNDRQEWKGQRSQC